MPVTVSSPVVKPIIEYDEFTGRLEAVRTVEVRPRVSGYIDSIHFDEGQKVKKGDLLVVIDPRPFQARVNSLQARVKQMEAARNLAKANKDRAQSLIDANAISREEYEVSHSEMLQAEADLEAAKADLEIAKLDLDFTRVTAPIDGIADRYHVTEGNLVTGEPLNATVLTTIVPHNPIYAYYEIDERSFLRNVRRYFDGEMPGRASDERLPAYLGLDDEEGYPHEGEIDFSSNRLNPNTATLAVRAIFENDDEFLTPGLFARVRVPISREKDTMLIPDHVIGVDQTHRFVWVINEDNTAEQRRLTLGPKHEGMRVVRSGLEPRDRIAVSGIQFIRPGMPVAPQEQTAEGES